MVGSAAAPAARCKSLRRLTLKMCLPQESARDALVCRGNPLRSGLLRLDVGRADHLTPLFGFVGKQPPVIGGRAADRVAAQLGKPQLQGRVCQGSVELLVQSAD